MHTTAVNNVVVCLSLFFILKKLQHRGALTLVEYHA